MLAVVLRLFALFGEISDGSTLGDCPLFPAIDSLESDILGVSDITLKLFDFDFLSVDSEDVFGCNISVSLRMLFCNPCEWGS